MNKLILSLATITILLFLAGCNVIDSNVIDIRIEKNKCEIHNQPLKEDKVQIIYGMVIFKPDFMTHMKAKEEKFPYSYSKYYAGCIRRDPQYALVKYCPVCRQEEEKYKKNNP